MLLKEVQILPYLTFTVFIMTICFLHCFYCDLFTEKREYETHLLMFAKCSMISPGPPVLMMLFAFLTLIFYANVEAHGPDILAPAWIA